MTEEILDQALNPSKQSIKNPTIQITREDNLLI